MRCQEVDKLFKRELQEIKRYYRGALLSLVIFFFAAGAGSLLLTVFGEEGTNYYDRLRQLILPGELPENILLYIWTRNASVNLLVLVLGIFTYRIWPVFILTLNGATCGLLVTAMAAASNQAGWEIWFFGILPHGLPELGAMFLACGASFYYRDLKMKGKLDWGRVANTYLLLVLPLLAVAAVVETQITPLLIGLFLW